jgi:hypothetical protein
MAHAYPGIAYSVGTFRRSEEALEYAWAGEHLLHFFGACELQVDPSLF